MRSGPQETNGGQRITDVNYILCTFLLRSGTSKSTWFKHCRVCTFQVLIPQTFRGPYFFRSWTARESRFCHFRPKKWSGYLRRPQAESRKLGPARGAGARRPNHESRKPNHVFAIFAQKNGPGTSEDRKPNPKSLARAPNNGNVIREGRITKREDRITFSGAPNNENVIREGRITKREDRITFSGAPNNENVIRKDESRNAKTKSRFPEPRITEM